MTSLKALLKKDTSTLTARVEFRKGYHFTVKYISRASLVKMTRESMVLKYDEKQKARVPSLDGEAFAKAFCSAAVTDWEGFTPRTLNSLFPIEIAGLTEEEKDAPLEYTEENLLLVLENTYELEQFLQESAMDARTFNPLKEDDEKN